MFHGIINLEPNFPPHFTLASKSVLLTLLHKDPMQRLGTNGAHEIKTSEFFSPINFQQLLMYLGSQRTSFTRLINFSHPQARHSTTFQT